MSAQWTPETEDLVAREIAYFLLQEGAAHRHDDFAQHILTALADAGWLHRVRTWYEDDPEPNVPAVSDCDHDVWLKGEGGWRHRYAKPATEPWAWADLRKNAPIIETEIPPGSPE